MEITVCSFLFCSVSEKFHEKVYFLERNCMKFYVAHFITGKRLCWQFREYFYVVDEWRKDTLDLIRFWFPSTTTQVTSCGSNLFLVSFVFFFHRGTIEGNRTLKFLILFFLLIFLLKEQNLWKLYFFLQFKQN